MSFTGPPSGFPTARPSNLPPWITGPPPWMLPQSSSVGKASSSSVSPSTTSDPPVSSSTSAVAAINSDPSPPISPIASIVTAKSVPIGAIVGGVLGSLVVIALLVTAFLFYRRRRKNLELDARQPILHITRKDLETGRNVQPYVLSPSTTVAETATLAPSTHHRFSEKSKYGYGPITPATGSTNTANRESTNTTLAGSPTSGGRGGDSPSSLANRNRIITGRLSAVPHASDGNSLTPIDEHRIVSGSSNTGSDITVQLAQLREHIRDLEERHQAHVEGSTSDSNESTPTGFIPPPAYDGPRDPPGMESTADEKRRLQP